MNNSFTVKKLGLLSILSWVFTHAFATGSND
jgi:hypothetical protein